MSLMLLQGKSLPDKEEIKELKIEVKKQRENLLTEEMKEIEDNCHKLDKKERLVG